jgi:hypothetical protein
MGICGVGASALGVVKPTAGAIIAGLAALTGVVLWAARVNAPALDRSIPSSGAALPAPPRAGRSAGGASEITQHPSWQLAVVIIAESTLSIDGGTAAARTPWCDRPACGTLSQPDWPSMIAVIGRRQTSSLARRSGGCRSGRMTRTTACR